MRSPSAFVVLATVLGGASLFAQQRVLVPAHADRSEGQTLVIHPFGVPGFRTQILVDGDAIAPTGALLTGLRFRADRTSLPLAATAVPNVEVRLSHSTVPLGSLSATYANNITAPQQLVFQGTVTLPGHVAGGAGPMPWDIHVALTAPFAYDRALGNLLIDIVGLNPPGQFPAFTLDGLTGGGFSGPFGEAFLSPGNTWHTLDVSNLGFIEPRAFAPGASLEFLTRLMPFARPGVLLLGTEPLAPALDLTPLGAPGNTVYVDPILLLAHTFVPDWIGFASTATIQVPNVPSLIGERIYAQSLLLETAANPLGVVLGYATETRLGDASEQFPMQQVDADDPAATVGTVLDLGWPLPEYAAAALRLEGVFF
jgi:hypothetical protein